jgi:hypothetical protein
MARWAALNARQQAFVDHYLVHRNPIEAYKIAYDGHDKSKNVLAACSTKLLRHELVQKAINESISKKSRRTVDDLIEDLRTIYAMAIEDRDLKAAIACIAQEAKLLGFDRLTVDHNVGGNLVIKVVKGGQEHIWDDSKTIEA